MPILAYGVNNMARIFKFFRGPKSSMPVLDEAQPGWVTDEKRLYVGNDEGSNTAIPNMEDLSSLESKSVLKTEKGAANGVASLDTSGKVFSSQLPSYVDDVVECYVVGTTPYAQDWLSLKAGGTSLTPENGKIYLIIGDGEYQNQEFRWSGSQYAQISKSLALGTTSTTAGRGDWTKTAYDHSQITDGNPHGTTYQEVGAAPESHVNVVGTSSVLGHVKPSDDFAVDESGNLTIASVDGGTFGD